MAPKRKKTGPHPPPPEPEQLRRSNRRVKAPTPTVFTTSDTDSDSSTVDVAKRRAPSKRNASKIKEGVAKAIRDLSAMEAKLQNDAKMQRLAVETSDLYVEEDEGLHSLPRGEQPLKSSKEVINQHVMDTGEPDKVEQVPMDNTDAEDVARDLAAAEKEADNVERGPKRAPPVNSEILPLPWSGRLGYVRPLS
jgi:UV DNA damage endonuclease